MEKKEMLYEGKAKKVYATDVEDVYIVDTKMMQPHLMARKKERLLEKV